MNEGIEKLWIKLNAKLKMFILSKVHNEVIADDILHEVFIKIHSKIDSVKDETKIQSWIYQITRNLIADHFRNSQKEQNGLPSLIESEEDEKDDFMSETLDDMIKMMDNLPTEYCEALCLTELKGISQKAYAEKIGISYSGAKSRVQRARIMLKDMLMNCCHYQFDKYGTVIDIHPIHCCCCSQHVQKSCGSA